MTFSVSIIMVIPFRDDEEMLFPIGTLEYYCYNLVCYHISLSIDYIDRKKNLGSKPF